MIFKYYSKIIIFPNNNLDEFVLIKCSLERSNLSDEIIFHSPSATINFGGVAHAYTHLDYTHTQIAGAYTHLDLANTQIDFAYTHFTYTNTQTDFVNTQMD